MIFQRIETRCSRCNEPISRWSLRHPLCDGCREKTRRDRQAKARAKHARKRAMAVKHG